jgi:proteasome-associated ATPase
LTAHRAREIILSSASAKEFIVPKRDRRDFDDREERRGEWSRFEESLPRGPETTFRALALLDRILQLPAASEDPKVRHHLLLMRHQLEVDEQQFEEARKLLAEYEEAYQKLTSPANRIGTYLGSPEEGIASVAMGDTEFFCNVDPKLEDPEFKVGTRVRLNEAYAVIGDLGYPTTGPIVKITELLEERLRVSMDAQGLSGRVVTRSSDLEEAPLKVGDEVRMEPNGRVALEHFAQRQVRDYYLEEVPQIPWEKIGGQEDAIRLIRDTIEMPLLYPELYARFEKKALKGILLYGPPGCGKTLIGKATAYNLTQEYRKRTQRDVKEYFMYINGPKILNMWLGESERIVREIFNQARERASEGHLVFIFIDEAESILRTRSSGRYLNIANTVVPQFAAEMDGLVSLENVVVMLTSNRPDYIDPAILRPERIDRKVKVGRPDRRASRDILAIYLHPGIPLDPAAVQTHGDAGAAREALLDEAIRYLFRRNEDTEFLEVHLRNGGVETLYWKDLLSGALLMSVVERAKDFAIKRAIEKGSHEEGVSAEDLTRAVRMEYKENEIFPKTDTQEDWLKLLDYEPENVVSLRPIRPGKGDAPQRRNII